MQYSFVFPKQCIIMVISCTVSLSCILREPPEGERTEGLTEQLSPIQYLGT